jgi:small membrane protein
MQWIKVPLVIAAVVILVMVFRHRKRVELRAGSRVLVLVLAAVAVTSIIDPDIPQSMANVLGVARGTDLLLYVLIVVFVLTTLGLYFRLRDTDQQLRRLVRSLAIEKALRNGGPPGRDPQAPDRRP